MQLVELAMPLDPVTRRELNLLYDASLRFQHGALQVAAPNAELDGNVPFIVFAIDNKGAGLFGDRRLEWDARSFGSAHHDVPNGVTLA